MTDRVYDVDHVTIGGKAAAQITGVKKGDKVIAVVELTIGSVLDRSFTSQGDQMIAQTRIGEAMILTDAEHDDFMVRLGEQRREREQPGMGDRDVTDPSGLRAELLKLKVPALREMCKERTLAQTGDKETLIQRIINNGG